MPRWRARTVDVRNCPPQVHCRVLNIQEKNTYVEEFPRHESGLNVECREPRGTSSCSRVEGGLPRRTDGEKQSPYPSLCENRARKQMHK